MFTGIVEDLGTIKSIRSAGNNITFDISTTLTGIEIDDSVACNGICLTVENRKDDVLTFTAVDETISKTNAGDWQTGDKVNLERTLTFNGRIDGHLVQGHVDTACICISKSEANGSYIYKFLFDEKFNTLVIEKGSVCLNGISLTAFDVGNDTFSVAIIPYTYAHTNIQYLTENEKVNLEFDMVGKYIQRYLSLQQSNLE